MSFNQRWGNGSTNDPFDDGWLHASTFTFSMLSDTMDDLNRLLNEKMPDAFNNRITHVEPIDPAVRLKQIDHELDIIKGRVSTPKGYKTSPGIVKSLIAERKVLIGKL